MNQWHSLFLRAKTLKELRYELSLHLDDLLAPPPDLRSRRVHRVPITVYWEYDRLYEQLKPQLSLVRRRSRRERTKLETALQAEFGLNPRQAQAAAESAASPLRRLTRSG